MQLHSKVVIYLLAAGALVYLPSMSHAAEAGDAKAVFEANGCTSCHAPSAKLVGPALKAIAKRYKGKAVSAEIAQRIKAGSVGRWGDMQHSANESISEDDAALIARWILRGAP